MTRFFALAFVAVLAVTPALASEITTELVLAATAVDDGVEPAADVYAIIGTNGLDQGVTAIGLNLVPADFGVSTFFASGGTGFANPSDLTSANGSLPEFRGFPITDSFVVLPEGLSALAATETFEPGGIVADYTTAGGTLIPANGSATLAHISVPTGEMPGLPAVFGSVVYADNTTTGDIVGIPEPSTCILAGLALVGFAARRNG